MKCQKLAISSAGGNASVQVSFKVEGMVVAMAETIVETKAEA
ncbi:hypothetical protein [Bifidobacterium sp.]